MSLFQLLIVARLQHDRSGHAERERERDDMSHIQRNLL